MGIKLKLILTTYIVYLWLTFVQSRNETADQDIPSKINIVLKVRENLQNLFDSIAKKNTRNSEIYRKILKQEVVRDQQAFNLMKGELQIAQDRNGYKSKTFYKKNDISKNIVATKRETNQNNGNTGQVSPKLVQKRKKLPVGITNIRQILEGDYIYVDKTAQIYNLILEHKYDYFMVRPKGFGKTLFLSTLEEIFKGNKKLFEGTAIYNSNYNWLKYTVLHFDFSQMDCHEPSEFENALKDEIKKMSKANGIFPLEGVDLKTRLRRLVEDLSKKTGARVVILVDEYDAPVTNSMTDIKIAEKYRNILSNFLTTITGLSDGFLQFTFVTGVHEYSTCGPQGCGQDQLVDITLNSKYATLMGFTKDELEINFAAYDPITGSRIPIGNILDEVQQRYHCYRFSEDEVSVYNPLSILTYLQGFSIIEYHSHHEKIPSFLVDSIRSDPHILFSLSHSATKGFVLQSPNDLSKRIDLEPFLFQIGYLTIRGHDMRKNWGAYELGFRNEDVKNTFFRVALEGLTKLDPNEIARDGDKMKQDLAALDVNSFIATLNIHISRIPLQLRQNATLEYYRAVFYLLMENYGCETEIQLDYSRTKVSDIDIFFKFTLEQSADVALAQVMETQTNNNKKVLCIGVDFSENLYNINDWKATLVDGGEVVRKFP